MVQNLSREEEQRGWHKAFIWGLSIAAVLAIIVVASPGLTDSDRNDRTGLEETTKTAAEQAEEKAAEDRGVATIGTKRGAGGVYLTDGSDRALYLFKGDSQGRGDTPAVSTCYEDCAKAWPPLTGSKTPGTAGQADPRLLGTVQRRDGEMQVIYNGWPLYYFAKDSGPQQATGQDVEDFGAEWYLVTPAGEAFHAEAETH